MAIRRPRTRLRGHFPGSQGQFSERARQRQYLYWCAQRTVPLEPTGPCPYRLVFPVHCLRRVCAAATLMDTSRLAFFWMRASYLHAALRVRASVPRRQQQQERDTVHNV